MFWNVLNSIKIWYIIQIREFSLGFFLFRNIKTMLNYRARHQLTYCCPWTFLSRRELHRCRLLAARVVWPLLLLLAWGSLPRCRWPFCCVGGCGGDAARMVAGSLQGKIIRNICNKNSKKNSTRTTTRGSVEGKKTQGQE